MNCPRCSAPMDPGARFCTRCGSPAAQAPVQWITCTCGHQVPSCNPFCGFCGTVLPQSWGAQKTAATPSVAGPLPRPQPGPRIPATPTVSVRPTPARPTPAPPPLPASRRPIRLLPLLWFVALFAVAFIGRGVFSTSAGTLALLVVTTVLAFVVRRPLAILVDRIGRIALARPIWQVVGLLPRIPRRILGIITPIVLSFILTPWLNQIFDSFGFLVFISALAINTLVAYFFFAQPPSRPAATSAGATP